ncbi:MAG TPA: hypothetical protein VES88_01690 [Gemmatimonadaceae bacterium]|nr:hypothetical protein [Gemmatimonadaceae bacterium]
MIDEDLDLLHEASVWMDPEDGCVTIWGKDDEGTTGFSEFGIETLVNFLADMRSQPGGIEAYLRDAQWSDDEINRVKNLKPRS